jgi:hypothetical protein
MADTSAGAGEASSAIELAKKVLEALTEEAADASEGKGSGSLPDEAAPPDIPTGLPSGGAAAVERYRKTARWVVGAFAAVGVLVFGSLPFANITDEGRDAWLITWGLALAGLGIALAVWAVSRVDEPEDASLGELKGDLPKASDNWFLPSAQALFKLKTLLEGPDGLNDIGPMYPGVDPGSSAEERISALIESLGRSAKARYWKAAEVAGKKISLDAATVELTARTADLDAAWKRWVEVVELTKAAASGGGGAGGDEDG